MREYWKWIIPLSLSLGTALAFLGNPEAWLVSLLVYASLLLAVMYSLTRLWHTAGKGRMLAWLLALTFFLRLGFGAFYQAALPEYGHPNPIQQAGYTFADAYHRDSQAWQLAQSDTPLWKAFTKTYSSDQYGGLLAFSALVYRIFGDTHRPLLIVLFAAGLMALGAGFLWLALKQTFGAKVAHAAGVIFALYPESILNGASQMREPFLVGFAAIAFWGLIAWQHKTHSRAWVALAVGFIGMLLISPGIALLNLVVFTGWLWFARGLKSVSWKMILVAVVVLFLGVLLFAAGASQAAQADTPFKIITEWFRLAVQWDMYQLERDSGWVQKLFSEMPAFLKTPFVAVYGILQPVLPATIAAPTTELWKITHIMRALGWYALIPFLVVALISVMQAEEKSQRRQLLWLLGLTWAWVIVAALRGGADLWDNPRYRLMVLPYHAILAGYTWVWWQKSRNPWLIRVLSIELILVIVFGQWYLSRYHHWSGQLPFATMVALVVLSGVLILIGGWVWDRYQANRRA